MTKCASVGGVAVSVSNLKWSDHTWWSPRWQHAKVVVIHGNTPEFQKWGLDLGLGVI